MNEGRKKKKKEKKSISNLVIQAHSLFMKSDFPDFKVDSRLSSAPCPPPPPLPPTPIPQRSATETPADHEGLREQGGLVGVTNAFRLASLSCPRAERAVALINGERGLSRGGSARGSGLGGLVASLGFVR